MATLPHPPTAREAHKAQAAAQFARVAATARLIATAVALALILRTGVAEPFNIPSASMLPTLAAGDYLLVAKWPYGFSRFSLPFVVPGLAGRVGGHLPARGDVVVFKTPRDNRTDFIKRIIGVPGDRVRMTGGRIELNGVLVPKVAAGQVVLPAGDDGTCPDGSRAPAAGCRVARFVETLGGRRYAVLDEIVDDPRDDTPLVTVPAGHFYVAGDNRDDSADSRMSLAEGGVGLVPAENLVGRAEIVFLSTAAGSLRLDRIGTRL